MVPEVITPITTIRPGVTIGIVTDPEGNLVEFVEQGIANIFNSDLRVFSESTEMLASQKQLLAYLVSG